jgi:hypothetical protein
MPVLLARYNISFLDAFGRPPRILPFEYFRSFKVQLNSNLVKLVLMMVLQVLQAFIQHEFKDFPGSSMVDRGKYLVLNLANSRILDERNWSGYVAPGSTIAMSMVVRKLLESSDSQEDRCPEPSCPGTWTKPETQSWVTWYVLDSRYMNHSVTKYYSPVCQKQILNFPAGNLNDGEEIAAQRPLNRGSSSGFAEYEQGSTGLRPTRPIRLGEERDGAELELEEDISFFKRIVQEITDLRHKPSKWWSVQPLMEETTDCLARFKLFGVYFQAVRAYALLGPVQGTGLSKALKYIEKSIFQESLSFETTLNRLLDLTLSDTKIFTPRTFFTEAPGEAVEHYFGKPEAEVWLTPIQLNFGSRYEYVSKSRCDYCSVSIWD